jgi:predicted Zn-dependent peptidase
LDTIWPGSTFPLHTVSGTVNLSCKPHFVEKFFKDTFSVAPHQDSQYVHRFDNGLILLGESMPWLDSVGFAVAIPAGSAFDPESRAGLASLTTEMILRGAGDRNSRQFLEELENLGIIWSEAVSRQHILLTATMRASRLPDAVAIFSDVILRPHIPREELEPARLGLIQDIRADRDLPEVKLRRELRRRFFPYPWNRSTQGEEETVTAIEWQDVRDFIDQHFRPEGTIFSVAGRFNWDDTVALVDNLFEGWRGIAPSPPAWRWEREQVRHIPFDSQQTHIGIAYRSVPYDDPRYFQARAALAALSGGTSARLFTEVREKRGLCYTVQATYHVIKDMGSVFCYSGTTAERAQETLDVLLTEIQRLKNGVQPEELQRVKVQLKSHLVFQQESSVSRARSLINDWVFLGRIRSVTELKEAVDGLTTDDVNRFLADSPPSDFTIVTLGPHALEVPREVL